MELPEADEDYLNEQGYEWTLHSDADQAGFLVIRNFSVLGGGLTPSTTDLMIRIPAAYNMAQLDMWYCDPPIRITTTNQLPDRADQFERYLDRNWQRFSRHLPSGAWKPGVDNLRTFMRHIHRELQGKG